MTGKQAAFSEIDKLLDAIAIDRLELVDLVLAENADTSAPLKHIDVCLGDIRELVEYLKGNKTGNAKVLVAIHGDGGTVTVESTAAIDVILVQPSASTNSEILKSAVLSPLPQQEFLEVVHDLLASAIQSGKVDLVEVNKTLEETQ